MLLSFKATRKDWAIRLVSRRMWLEIAAWATQLSAITNKRWLFKLRGKGFLIVTPLISMGVTVDVG